MEKAINKSNLKRKRNVSSFPEALKSGNLQDVIQSSALLFQKLGQNNDHESLLTTPRTIKMFIRGLGSSNTQVQKNYFAVLVALLKSFSSSSEFSTSHVMDAITSELHATGHIKKGEEREILMGRVLAFGVLVRSGVLQLASKEEQTTLLTQFFQDLKEKSYLPLVGDPFLITFIKQIDEGAFKRTLWPLLSQEVRPGPDQTLLLYHCLLVCEERFPTVVTTKYLKQTLGSPTVLSTSTTHGLLEALKGEIKLKTLEHPAFSDIFKYVVSSEETLSSFWQEVEKQLLVESSSLSNKAIVGIKMFTIISSQLQQASQVVLLLTPTLLTWFMKKIRSPVNGKLLHKITKDALKSLLLLCNKADSPKTSYSVLKKLLFNPGSLLFDQQSGSKTVSQLVGQLKDKQVHKLAEVLRDVITGARLAVEHKEGEETTRPWTNREKLYAVHLLGRLIHMSPTQSNMSWRLEQLTFLFDMGFFSETNIGVELAGAVRNSFFSSLNHKLPSINDLQEILSGVAEHINKHLIKGDQLRIKVPAEVLPAWNKMYQVTKQLGEDKKHKKDSLWLPKVFKTMFYHIGLHLFKEASLAKDFLEELHSVYERVDRAAQSQDEPHWTEVVTEMFLSLLSRNSHRHLLGCIFTSFCHIMTPQNIHQILQVLDPTNNSNPLLNQLDSDSESPSEEEGSGDEAEDDKEVEEEESSDDGMTDGDDDMEEDLEEKVNDKLRRAVIEALGDTGAMTDTESVDLDKMDENEAKRVDEALSAAFQAFKPSKKKKESSHIKALAHFRSRVLDLIEVWMARVETPPLDLTVDVLIRLMTLLEHSLVDRHQSQLETRVRSVIKKLTGTMTKTTFDTSDSKDLNLGSILKSILDKGERTTTVYMSVHQELIDVTLFIVRVSQHLPVDSEDEGNVTVPSVLKDAMNSYFTQRDCLIPPKLFSGLFVINVPFMSQLASKLLGYAFDPSVPPYRQSKALEFLIAFWRNNRIVNEPSEDLLEKLKKMSRKLYKASVKMIEEPKDRVPDKFLNELKLAFKIIQKKQWLADIDLDQHMNNLKEFHQTIVKMKKVNSHHAVTSVKAMDIENDNHKSKAEEEEVVEENDKSEDDEESEDDGEESENGNISENEESDDTEQMNGNKRKKSSSKEEGKGVENENEEGTEEEVSEEEDSAESSSEPEEPPTKKAKKKADKKKNPEKLRRIQLLKNNSKKLRMESMSAGLDENVFSKYRLLLNKKSASPER